MIRRPLPEDLPGFQAAVEGRHSVRRFTTDPVPRDDAREMVRLATLAANAGNAQPWRFVAVDDAQVLGDLRRAVDERIDEIARWPEVEAAGLAGETGRMHGYSSFFADAPLAIAVCGLPYESLADRLLALRGVPLEERDRLRARPDLQSVGAAVQLLITAAHVMGYGACWLSAPVIAAPRLEELLGIAEPARLVAIVAVGVPAAQPPGAKRLPLDRVLRFVPPEAPTAPGPGGGAPAADGATGGRQRP
ncbi:MAG: nitroreductase family protein [Thermoleophilia bacterium]